MLTGDASTARSSPFPSLSGDALTGHRSTRCSGRVMIGGSDGLAGLALGAALAAGTAGLLVRRLGWDRLRWATPHALHLEQLNVHEIIEDDTTSVRCELSESIGRLKLGVMEVRAAADAVRGSLAGAGAEARVVVQSASALDGRSAELEAASCRCAERVELLTRLVFDSRTASLPPEVSPEVASKILALDRARAAATLPLALPDALRDLGHASANRQPATAVDQPPRRRLPPLPTHPPPPPSSSSRVA